MLPIVRPIMPQGLEIPACLVANRISALVCILSRSNGMNDEKTYTSSGLVGFVLKDIVCEFDSEAIAKYKFTTDKGVITKGELA
jgi:hypothetical protein